MRKLVALITVISMLLASLSTAAAMPDFGSETVAEVTYRIDGVQVTDGKLAPGSVLATVQFVSPSPGKYIVSLGRYDGDGRLAGFFVDTQATASIGGYNAGRVKLMMNVSDGLEDGAYVRVIVMDALTLEPVTVNDSMLVYRAPETDVKTAYDGIYERYYTLDGEGGSIAVVQDGSVKRLSAADEGTPFRLKDMGDGWVGFADGKYRLYDNDGTPGRRIYGFGSETMLWKLILHGDKYYIQNHDGSYLAIEGEAVVLRSVPCDFTLTKTGETPFTLVTATEGYKLLTDAQRQRLTEICTSPGAVVLPNGSNGNSLLDTMEAAFTRIYDNRDATTPEAQKSAILAAMQTTANYNSAGTNEINAVTITGLPGGDANISQSGPVKEKLYIWDAGDKEYNRLDVTYTGFGHSQTVKFYYDETGAGNVQAAIQALTRFPYEYRQFIQQVNVYVPASSFTYNCDGKVLTVRVADNTGVETMVRNFAHELGHSVEFLAGGAAYEKPETHWCGSDEWKKAIEDDILPVSKYGSSNSDEGLAEFARLYFQGWYNRDMRIGVKTLYPNRYASFNNLLSKIGMEPLY